MRGAGQQAGWRDGIQDRADRQFNFFAGTLGLGGETSRGSHCEWGLRENRQRPNSVAQSCGLADPVGQLGLQIGEPISNWE